LNETFYDPNFHGADWKKVRTKYRDLVKHCAMKEDLYALVSLMIGELNASHMGISGNLGTPDQQTADLGLLFDPRHPGPDLKVVEIVKNGPADQRGINLRAGDRVIAIDGVKLTEKTSIAKLLNDKVGEVVTLHVTAPDGAGKRRVEIRGQTRTKMNEPMYERWIAKNAQKVAELSKGKLGYIHIPNMQEPGLERFVRALYSDNFDKEGIVLDVRYNGGGFTHDQVLNYLTGKEHTIFSHRDGSSGLVLRSYDRKWTKPLVLLINNRSYSDAEIFPHAFRTWGLGKLVGQPTGGFVIGTRQVTLIDGSAFRTPRIGVHTIKGVNMEKEGVMPDILVEPHPDELARGIDRQLERAVEVLTSDVTAWKKTRPPQVGATGVISP
jgi:tricorn protease